MLTIAVLAVATFSCGSGSSNSAKSENDSGGNTFQAGELTVKIDKDGSITAKDINGVPYTAEPLIENSEKSKTFFMFRKKPKELNWMLVNVDTKTVIADWEYQCLRAYSVYRGVNMKAPDGSIVRDVVCGKGLDKNAEYPIADKIQGGGLHYLWNAESGELLHKMIGHGFMKPFEIDGEYLVGWWYSTVGEPVAVAHLGDEEVTSLYDYQRNKDK
ncbi:MAG: hypothetical protein LBQ73_05250 [Tannerellaceae bacterium]|nr:hypothetical protein [Tannerellaceae bacterium]